MSKYIDKAIELRAGTPRPNCAQTVMVVFANEVGLSAEKLSAIGTNFGHGMKCGSICGAITGALMTLGMLFPDDKNAATELLEYMASRHGGMTNCAPLLESNRVAGGNQKAFCDELIFDAIRFIEDRLQR